MKTHAGATDTSNMTTFEENKTGAGNTTSGGDWTKIVQTQSLSSDIAACFHRYSILA
jgi:hypothetical protein